MRRLFIVAAAFAVLLVACGGPGAPSTSIRVTMTEYSFSPNTFTVPAGQQIAASMTNSGAVAHSLVIMKLGTQVNHDFSDADEANVYWQQAPLDPGQSASASFAAPSEPGEYEILCAVAGHLESGMVGKLIVVGQP